MPNLGSCELYFLIQNLELLLLRCISSSTNREVYIRQIKKCSNQALMYCDIQGSKGVAAALHCGLEFVCLCEQSIRCPNS